MRDAARCYLFRRSSFRGKLTTASLSSCCFRDPGLLRQGEVLCVMCNSVRRAERWVSHATSTCCCCLSLALASCEASHGTIPQYAMMECFNSGHGVDLSASTCWQDFH